MTIHGDHRMTAGITVAHKHRGEAQLTPEQQDRKSIERESAGFRRQSDRLGQAMALLISKRDDIRHATTERSLFAGRDDPVCVAILKRASDALGPAIGEARQLMEKAEKEADAAWERIVELDNKARGIT